LQNGANSVYPILILSRMTTSYPDKDEDLGVSDAVLALRHPDHGELGRTLTLRHQVAHLGHKKYLVKIVAKDAI
jgi:hypothetical protein